MCLAADAPVVGFLGTLIVTGTLKGWDPLLNLVLDETTEQLRGKEDVYCLSIIQSSCWWCVC